MEKKEIVSGLKNGKMLSIQTTRIGGWYEEIFQELDGKIISFYTDENWKEDGYYEKTTVTVDQIMEEIQSPKVKVDWVDSNWIAEQLEEMQSEEKM